MLKKLVLPVAAALAMSVPVVGYSWNIICGVSILSFREATMSTKWEADSAAIRATSELYAAIADLQSINVEVALQDASGPEKVKEVTKTTNALAHFKASRDQLAVAQTKAGQMVTASNPLDNIGQESIALWKQLADYEYEFILSLEGGSLPDLYRLHEAIDLIHRIDNLGMRASLMHLNQHKLHHTTGGATTHFK